MQNLSLGIIILIDFFFYQNIKYKIQIFLNIGSIFLHFYSFISSFKSVTTSSSFIFILFISISIIGPSSVSSSLSDSFNFLDLPCFCRSQCIHLLYSKTDQNLKT
jgi:hypothetical protein